MIEFTVSYDLELLNYWRIARVALPTHSRLDRLNYAATEFSKVHTGIKMLAAYKRLDKLTRGPSVPLF